MDTYETIYHSLIDDTLDITHYIYVDTCPEICYNRMVARNRHGEGAISRDYLDKCHHLHLQMMAGIDHAKLTIFPGDLLESARDDALQHLIAMIKALA